MTDKKLHTKAGRANARGLFTPAFWRSFAALSLVLSVSSFKIGRASCRERV